jgi:hypothetical protein
MSAIAAAANTVMLSMSDNDTDSARAAQIDENITRVID